jgi:hypothetical protein
MHAIMCREIAHAEVHSNESRAIDLRALGGKSA